MENLTELPEIKSLVVIGKRWFDRVYGNTYHSCLVIVNGEEKGFIPFEYGYGDCYKQTALKILQGLGYFNNGLSYPSGANKDYCDFLEFTRNNRDICLFYVTDVNRKKDLKK